MTGGFTKFCKVAAIPHKSATVVARTLFERWIVRYSAPESIVLDQGKEFCNKVMCFDKATSSYIFPVRMNRAVAPSPVQF
jgi:hypothetical protein